MKKTKINSNVRIGGKKKEKKISEKYMTYYRFVETMEAEGFEVHREDNTVYIKTDVGRCTTLRQIDMRDVGMIPLDQTGTLHIFDAYWFISTQENKVFSKSCSRFTATPFEHKGI